MVETRWDWQGRLLLDRGAGIQRQVELQLFTPAAVNNADKRNHDGRTTVDVHSANYGRHGVHHHEWALSDNVLLANLRALDHLFIAPLNRTRVRNTLSFVC